VMMDFDIVMRPKIDRNIRQLPYLTIWRLYLHTLVHISDRACRLYVRGL
jgi:hypothetical protein